jgi:formylglycine-generating enzyme required for sulfatase activity
MLGKPTLKPDLERASHRVLRGGGWRDGPQRARVADRGGLDPGSRGDRLGFRLVRNTIHEGEQHEKEG